MDILFIKRYNSLKKGKVMKYIYLTFFIISTAFAYNLVVSSKENSEKLENIGFVCEEKYNKYVCLSSPDLDELKKVKDFLLDRFHINAEIVTDLKKYQNHNIKPIKRNKISTTKQAKILKKVKSHSNYCIQLMSFKNFNNAKKVFNWYKQYPFTRVEKIEGFYVVRVGEGNFDDINELKKILKKGIVRKCDLKYDRIILSNFEVEKNNKNTKNVEEFVKEGNYKKALNFYKQILASSPKNIKALKGLEDIYIKLKDFKKALEISNRLIKLGVKDKNRILILKNLVKSKLDIAEKKRYLEEILKIDSNDIESLLLLGDIYTKEKKYNVAYIYYLRAYSLNKNDIKVIMKFAKLLLKLNLKDEAKEILKNINISKLNDKEKKELEEIKKML